MIAIDRPAESPHTLDTKGKTARANLKREFLDHEADCRSGKRKLQFVRDIYSATDVKRTLIAMQHNKCAYDTGCSSRRAFPQPRGRHRLVDIASA